MQINLQFQHDMFCWCYKGYKIWTQ